MPLESELAFLQEHRDALLRQYGPKFLIIHGQEVSGAFDTLSQALERAAALFGTGNVLIRQASEETATVSAPAYSLGILRANHPR